MAMNDGNGLKSGRELVRLDGVSVTRDSKMILSGIDLAIKEKSCVRILGGNGSGKTTLLRLIKGDINQDGGISPSRRYFFDGDESCSPITARTHVRFVSPAYQDRYGQKGWNLSGEEIISTGFDESPLLYRDLTSAEREQVIDIASWLNINHLLGKSILSMSRGEGRRILIARALVSGAGLILLDEFLHELDPRGRSDVIEIAERASSEGRTIVYTGHRIDERLPSTDTEYVIENGILREASDSDLSRPVSRRSKFSGKTAVKESVRELFRLKSCSVFFGEKAVLRGITVGIDNSQNWTVLGGNGAGKSTLMRLLYGYCRPAIGGEIVRCGVRDGELLHGAQSRMGFLSSEFQARYDGECTAFEAVLSGLRGSIGVYDEFSDDERDTAMKHLAAVNLDHFAHREFSTFSYGEQRRILFARACAHRPDVMILDEPFAGVDAQSRENMLSRIEELSTVETRFVISVHHAEDIPMTTTHILHIESGRVVYSGTIEGFPLEAYMSGV